MNSSTSSINRNASENATIQIRGLGHSLTMHHPPSIPISALFENIQALTGLPTSYQRIIIRGKTLIYSNNNNTDINSTKSTPLDMKMPLHQICPGFKEGSTSKGILMHSKNYKLDQVTVERITKLNHELDSIEHKIKRLSESGLVSLGGGGGGGGKDAIACGGEEMTRKVAQHLITGIMCQLDTIDVGGSDTLRDIRRKVLHRAEAMDRLWGAKEGNDTEI